MRRIPLLLSAAGLALLACNNENQEKTAAQTANTDSLAVTKPLADSTLSGCYSLAANRDTASLQIEVKSSQVDGQLSYNFYQKDRNDGNFQGEVNNDRIIGWYLFRSEGLMSVRQVAWQVKGTELWPAVGEMIVRNDTAMFAKPEELKFDSTRALVKVRCII